jgi:hypothetical protein
MKLALTYYADAERDVVRFRYDVPWERVRPSFSKACWHGTESAPRAGPLISGEAWDSVCSEFPELARCGRAFQSQGCTSILRFGDGGPTTNSRNARASPGVLKIAKKNRNAATAEFVRFSV